MAGVPIDDATDTIERILPSLYRYREVLDRIIRDAEILASIERALAEPAEPRQHRQHSRAAGASGTPAGQLPAS
jgi:hypothetical protein